MPIARGVEVDAALGVICATFADEDVDDPAHRWKLSRRVRHHVGFPPPQTPHIGEERALLAAAEVAPTHAIAGRTLQDRLVDIGDVLRIADGLSGCLEMAYEDVKDEERARVTQMCRVVWRDAADVQRDRARERTERDDRAAARVV